MRNVLIALSFLILPTLGTAAESFTLVYKNDNKWVSEGDKEPLRKLLDASKENSHRVFQVSLPDRKAGSFY